jgi:hypothetical protein
MCVVPVSILILTFAEKTTFSADVNATLLLARRPGFTPFHGQWAIGQRKSDYCRQRIRDVGQVGPQGGLNMSIFLRMRSREAAGS